MNTDVCMSLFALESLRLLNIVKSLNDQDLLDSCWLSKLQFYKKF
jgi:hypothetical protein